MPGLTPRTRAVALRAVRRAVAIDALRWTAWALLAIGVALLALTAADRLAVIHLDRFWVWAILAGATALVVGSGAAWRARWSVLRAASEVDRASRLHDRLSSGLALADEKGDGFAAWAVSDAERAAERCDPSSASRFNPRVWWGAGPALLAAAWGLLAFAPRWSPEDRDGHNDASRAAAIGEIDDLAAELQAAQDDPALESIASPEDLAALDDLEREIREGTLTPEDARTEAARQLAELADEAERQAEQTEQATDSARGALDALSQSDRARELADALRDEDFAQAGNALDALQDELDRLPPEERAQAIDDLRRLAEALEREAANAQERDLDASSEPSDAPPSVDRDDTQLANPEDRPDQDRNAQPRDALDPAANQGDTETPEAQGNAEQSDAEPDTQPTSEQPDNKPPDKQTPPRDERTTPETPTDETRKPDADVTQNERAKNSEDETGEPTGNTTPRDDNESETTEGSKQGDRDNEQPSGEDQRNSEQEPSQKPGAEQPDQKPQTERREGQEPDNSGVRSDRPGAEPQGSEPQQKPGDESKPGAQPQSPDAKQDRAAEEPDPGGDRVAHEPQDTPGEQGEQTEQGERGEPREQGQPNGGEMEQPGATRQPGDTQASEQTGGEDSADPRPGASPAGGEDQQTDSKDTIDRLRRQVEELREREAQSDALRERARRWRERADEMLGKRGGEQGDPEHDHRGTSGDERSDPRGGGAGDEPADPREVPTPPMPGADGDLVAPASEPGADRWGKHERTVAEWYSPDAEPGPNQARAAPAAQLDQAQRAAERAIDEQLVPPSRRDYVRRVFERLRQTASEQRIEPDR